ncbi:MAG: serine/threonine protein kinase [Pseudorhodoplanes sp.]
MGDVTIPQDLAGRWRTEMVLKRDVFSTVERGVFATENGETPAVLRRTDTVPWWTYPLARLFLAREARALKAAGDLAIAPRLLHRGSGFLVRSWIDALPLHIARPEGDIRYFATAKAAILSLHRTGFTHNDLAKEQNWLRTPDGRAMLTDFQLAAHFRRRGRLFRLAAYEDLRHMLKHKRRYAPAALTPAETRVLARKSLPTRIWMATGKRVYYAVTRGLLNFTDREGGGPRLVNDAPVLTAKLKAHPGVRDAAIVPFPDRRTGTGLYAFVESRESERALSDYLGAQAGNVKTPEILQAVEALPRRPSGEVRTEILILIAMNQVDQIGPLVTDDSERGIVERIVAGRRNLRDRFAY